MGAQSYDAYKYHKIVALGLKSILLQLGGPTFYHVSTLKLLGLNIFRIDNFDTSTYSAVIQTDSYDCTPNKWSKW